ncbi:MAG: LysR family transcriptional regulator [Pirellulaceae bacterium]|nr:LysR family transcriptional regulator [Pirellulaceae bacterium]
MKLPPQPAWESKMAEHADSLTMQQVITFCQVYERGGYAGAAESLGLAGPTIWEQVKSLEKIYKTKLFDRSGRNVRPSAAGTVLYEMLRPILASVISTFERLAEETDDAVQQVSLVTCVRMMLEELGAPLRKFSQIYPDACLKLISADNAIAQEFILKGKADLALLIEPSQSMLAPGIAYERLYPIEYLVAFPPRHRLSRQASVTIADLMNEPLILGNPNTIVRKMFEQACFRLGINEPLRIVAETDNSAITIACVQSGIGVGIIASRPKGNLTKHVVTRSISNEIGQVHVVAAYRKGRIPTKVLQTLLDLLREVN